MWSVRIKIKAPKGERFTERETKALFEALIDHEPGIALTPRFMEPSITVDVDDAAEAIVRAVTLVRRALVHAGLRPDLPFVLVEAMTEEEMDAEIVQGQSGNVPELAGVSELATIIGVSRQRAAQIARSQSFPKPLARLASGPVWSKDDVEQFAAISRAPGAPSRGQRSLPARRSATPAPH